MDNGFHPPLHDPRTLRLGRVFKPTFMPPAYVMDVTVRLIKESPPNAAWICKRGQLYILMRVKEVGINTVVFDYRGKSFVLRFHQTPGIARPLRGYTVAEEWLLPLVKRFGLVQEPVKESTEMVKWNTGWCAPRFDPRKTLIAQFRIPERKRLSVMRREERTVQHSVAGQDMQVAQSVVHRRHVERHTA